MGRFWTASWRRVGASLFSGVVVLAGVTAASPAPAVTSCVSPPSVYPESSVTAGLTATGLTVIQGTNPTSFDVTVLGIQPNFILPGHDLYEVQITGPGSFLDATGGIVAGMSGSPVYVGSDLLGAVSYGYYFADHTIGFLTPGQDMVNIFNYPTLARAVSGLSTRSMPVSDTSRRAAAKALGVKLSTIPDTAQPIPLPEGISGVSSDRLASIADVAAKHDYKTFSAPVTYAGGSVSTSGNLNPNPIQPGHSFVGLLSSGDISFWGGGTATEVCGNLTVAFGHPFFFDGQTSYGMSEAQVLTIIKDPSGITGGFKEMVPGNLHGMVTQDRFAGIMGTAGPVSTPVPITTDFSNPDLGTSLQGESDVYFQGERYAVPDITWYHLFGSLDSVDDRFGDGTVSIDYTITGIDPDGQPFTVTNRNMLYNPYDADYGAYKLVSAMYALSYNRFGPITFTGVDASGSITQQDLEGTITQIKSRSGLEKTLKSRSVVKVKAGHTLELEIVYSMPDGSTQTADVNLRAPNHGSSFQAITLRGGKSSNFFNSRDIGSFDELVSALSGGEHANDLIVNAFGRSHTREQAVVVKGSARQYVQIVG